MIIIITYRNSLEVNHQTVQGLVPGYKHSTIDHSGVLT